MKARELDTAFDENTVDVIGHLDVNSARRPQREVQRVNVDFPVWMLSSRDAEAARFWRAVMVSSGATLARSQT